MTARSRRYMNSYFLHAGDWGKRDGSETVHFQRLPDFTSLISVIEGIIIGNSNILINVVSYHARFSVNWIPCMTVSREHWSRKLLNIRGRILCLLMQQCDSENTERRWESQMSVSSNRIPAERSGKFQAPRNGLIRIGLHILSFTRLHAYDVAKP